MKDATQIVIVLDRSGSMEVVHEATIESFNQFLIEQKAHPSEAAFSLCSSTPNIRCCSTSR